MRLALFLLALPLAAQVTPPTQPTGVPIPPQGREPTQVTTCQSPDGRVIPCPPVVTVVDAAPAAPLPPLSDPAQLYTLNAGVQGLGPSQVFGSYSVSQCLSLDMGKCAAYTTEIQEFARLKGGKVGMCVRAGVSKPVQTLGPIVIGLVGDAGACEGQTGSASGAISARTFVALRFGRSPVYLIGTAQDLKTAGVGSQTTITLGIGYGVFK